MLAFIRLDGILCLHRLYSMHAIHDSWYSSWGRHGSSGAGRARKQEPQSGVDRGAGGWARGFRSRRAPRSRRHLGILEDRRGLRSRHRGPRSSRPGALEVRVALDTNRYVDLCKGIAETVEIVATAESVFLPFVVLAELRAGFAVGRRAAENERVLRRFLLKDGVRVL